MAAEKAKECLPPARTLGLFGATLLLWLVTRPYFGIVQDAKFYMLEALRNADPGRFAGDLYFQFGSQGSFSIFPHLYPPLLAVFDIGTAALILTIAGQLLWLAGLFYRVRGLVGQGLRGLSMAGLIGMLNIYAPFLGYGKAFLTP